MPFKMLWWERISDGSIIAQELIPSIGRWDWGSAIQLGFRVGGLLSCETDEFKWLVVIVLFCVLFSDGVSFHSLGWLQTSRRSSLPSVSHMLGLQAWTVVKTGHYMCLLIGISLIYNMYVRSYRIVIALDDI